ncbi:MAG TPA: hypothetical protein VLV50_18430 [Stellaceae bacterium]|nr:hypothetical protein [Stellaceae bacterium]
MKLFQIEEPDGPLVDSDAAGAAVGIDLAVAVARVAIAVGGNAEILPDADGNRALDVVGAALGDVLLALRARAEKQLARPVTHAAIASDADGAAIARASDEAGLALLRHVARGEAAALAPGAAAEEAAVLGAAMIAEDMVPGGSAN